MSEASSEGNVQMDHIRVEQRGVEFVVVRRDGVVLLTHHDIADARKAVPGGSLYFADDSWAS